MVALVVHLALRPIEETDLFFRLASGDEVLRRGSLFHRNLFSFTYPDHPYLDSAWLFDLGAAVLYRAGGFPALVIGKTALVLAAFLGAFTLALRRGASGPAAAIVMAIAALLVQPRMVERPHLFSFAVRHRPAVGAARGPDPCDLAAADPRRGRAVGQPARRRFHRPRDPVGQRRGRADRCPLADPSATHADARWPWR